MMRSVRSAVYIGLVLLCLQSCSRPPGPQSSPSPAVRSQPLRVPAGSSPPVRSSAAPGRAAKSAPAQVAAPPPAAATPGPTAAPSGAIAAKPVLKVPLLPPNAAPQIISVDVSETTVRSGDHVWGKVVTTSNVASVEARIGNYAMSLNKVGVGRFALAYVVAPLPWFVHGTFAMRVIAKNTRGDTVERTIPLSVR
ncbi:MAG TPA: hypothetical protein VGM99_08135 [Candidatus Cybelea sp.]